MCGTSFGSQSSLLGATRPLRDMTLAYVYVIHLLEHIKSLTTTYILLSLLRICNDTLWLPSFNSCNVLWDIDQAVDRFDM